MGRVKMMTKKKIPFLDNHIGWTHHARLIFSVYNKLGQQIKFMGDDSTHTLATRKVIPSGVFDQLSKLASETEEEGRKTIEEKYPKYVEALT